MLTERLGFPRNTGWCRLYRPCVKFASIVDILIGLPDTLQLPLKLQTSHAKRKVAFLYSDLKVHKYLL